MIQCSRREWDARGDPFLDTATRSQQLTNLMTGCSHQVREALLGAEISRLTEVVGMGADGDVTTQVDKIAEDAALSYLDSAEPRVNILSEEIGFIDKGSTLTAIVDPVDATHNALSLPRFKEVPDEELPEVLEAPARQGHLYGYPFYAFSIGIVEDDQLVAGCVRNLPTGTTFSAIRGEGVEIDGIPVQGSGAQTLPGTTIGMVRAVTEAGLELIKRLTLTHNPRLRICGCSALDLALISCGVIDGFMNPNIASTTEGIFGEKIVDYAGGWALLQEAGGVLTGIDGSPMTVDLDLARRTPLLAAITPELHQQILEIVRGVDAAAG